MLTIFFGDCDSTTATQAKQFDLSACLLTEYNMEQLSNDATVYTSLADLPKDLSQVYQLLDRADTIVYCPPERWSDNLEVDVNNPTKSMQGLTEFILNTINQEKGNVKNVNLFNYPTESYTKLVSSRKTDNPQLWVAGCSTSHATGVKDTERYGNLVADRLGLAVSFLTFPGSSIQWATDQILRSDIKEDDIVIWGLTDESRFPLWTESNELIHIHANQAKATALPSNIIDRLLVDPTNFYQAITHVYQVINFCKKTKAKLLILGLNASDALSLHLHNRPEFIKFINKLSNTRYIDLGTDNQHPGPKQHKIFADLCINKLKALNYI